MSESAEFERLTAPATGGPPLHGADDPLLPPPVEESREPKQLTPSRLLHMPAEAPPPPPPLSWLLPREFENSKLHIRT